MQEEQMIISINEYRKLISATSEMFTDDEIEEQIIKLDLLAKIYLNNIGEKSRAADSLCELDSPPGSSVPKNN